MSDINRDDVLPALLLADDLRSRDEPDIAANIATQLEHMGLHTWSISVIRRLRDAIGRLSPSSVLEIGASIGHRSAWLYDLFTTQQPIKYDLVEQGAKFGVILFRLQSRYEAASWSNILVGEFSTLLAEAKAWSMTMKSGVGTGEKRLDLTYDAIIVDDQPEHIASTIGDSLPLLSRNGVLFAVEPPTPTGDYDDLDENEQAKVDGFNDWIKLIESSHETHHLAFVPLFEGTLVAFFPR
jgi:predicted O-methyltransferase YrrM